MESPQPFAAHLNSVGLLMDIAGVILLFLFGLPPNVDRLGRNILVSGGKADNEEVKKGKLYDRLSWLALALIVIGFGLQIVGNYMV